MKDVRTVSDTKRAFYSYHTRPINSIFRRVVEELMVEIHLLSVNVDFSYNSLYALGVVTTFDRFMQGYQPERDRESIFNALCQATQSDSGKYRGSATEALAAVSGLSLDAFLEQVKHLDSAPDQELWRELRAIASNPKFKYSRLFAVGLYTLLEHLNAEALKDEKQRNDLLQQIAEPLHLSADKMQKDLELYRGNLEKMAQAQAVLEDILKAERKKREEREQAKNAVATPPSPADPV